MKRLLLALTLLLTVTLCSCSKASPKESPAEDFTYEMSDGEVVITGYTGTDLEIYIPAKINDRPVTMIGEEAFEGYDMTHITVPDSVTVIGESAFSDCNCLSSVKLSKNLEKIEEYAFLGCDALETVSFPSSLKRINEGAFRSSSLKKVSLPVNLETLGANSFTNCGKLSSLKIPDNTKIEISVVTQSGNYGYVTTFTSPVGGSSTTTYYDSQMNAAFGKKDFEKLQTTIIVSKNSYAHQQVKDYANYGLTISVE